jgi:hypothetical protein
VLEHVHWLHFPCHWDFQKCKWFHMVSDSVHILTHLEYFSASRIISHTKVWLNGMIYLSWEQFVSLNGEKFVNLLLVYVWATPYSCIMAVWFIYLNRDVSNVCLRHSRLFSKTRNMHMFLFGYYGIILLLVLIFIVII